MTQTVSAISIEMIQKMVRKASQKLQGEWVLLGGSLLLFFGENHRVTTDIDLVSLDSGHMDSLPLMQIAEELGLPVETINQASAFYLKKIKNFNKDLVLIVKKKGIKIFRPNINLFLALKMKRMSESDLADCLLFLKISKKLGDRVDHKRIDREIKAALLVTKNPFHRERLEMLSVAARKLT